jgi:hypothetical protein
VLFIRCPGCAEDVKLDVGVSGFIEIVRKPNGNYLIYVTERERDSEEPRVEMLHECRDGRGLGGGEESAVPTRPSPDEPNTEAGEWVR